MELLSEELTHYLENSCEPENELLKHINRETHLKVSMPRMLSGHYQGKLLSMISKLINPERILEIGTFTGYATLCLAEGLRENGRIYTIDINLELEDMVRSNFKRSNLDSKIMYQIGDAKEIIPTLNEIFDYKVDLILDSKGYLERNIELVENSPYEILDVVIEMHKRLNREWEDDHFDIFLQNKFWQIFNSHKRSYNNLPLHGVIKSRYSTSFLKKNPNWLT